MVRDTVIVLGIPLDNITLSETVERIFQMIEEYREDGKPRQVATVNVDFIVNTLAWECGGIRHPELLDILRRADLVTADGMPVVWMSRLQGCPLKERVTGADLVPALATEAARRGASLFFLGGCGDVGQQAADLLVRRNPGLKIAGVSSPFVYTEGEHLADFTAEDEAIVAEINAARPDILLIAFGNPKQELWLARNAPRLTVPVSIGIGGTFEFIVGRVSRAPLWVQKAGMEWLYRILMEPRRLWKRYAIGLFKFGRHAWPAIRGYRAERSRIPRLPLTAPELPLDLDIMVVALPVRLDALAAHTLSSSLIPVIKSSGHLILDFAQVDMVDSSGLGFLVQLWRQSVESGASLYLATVNDHVLEFFRFNRVADLFRERLCPDREQAVERLRRDRCAAAAPFRLADAANGAVVVALSGRLDALAMKKIHFEELLPALEGKECLLDLTSLEFIDSSGLVALFRIQRHLEKSGGTCALYAPNDSVRQLLQMTRLDRMFTIAPGLPPLTSGSRP